MPFSAPGRPPAFVWCGKVRCVASLPAYMESKILGVSGKKATKPRLECESLQLDTVLRAIWSVHDSGNGVLSPFSRHEKVVSF
jgi:hypothetical protein